VSVLTDLTRSQFSPDASGVIHYSLTSHSFQPEAVRLKKKIQLQIDLNKLKSFGCYQLDWRVGIVEGLPPPQFPVPR